MVNNQDKFNKSEPEKKKEERCEFCNGSGMLVLTDGKIVNCVHCIGSGIAKVSRSSKSEADGFDWDKDKTNPNPCCEDCMKRNGVRYYCYVYTCRCPYYACKEKRECSKCDLYGECDHQGAYLQKNGKWCYDASGGEKLTKLKYKVIKYCSFYAGGDADGECMLFGSNDVTESRKCEDINCRWKAEGKTSGDEKDWKKEYEELEDAMAFKFEIPESWTIKDEEASGGEKEKRVVKNREGISVGSTPDLNENDIMLNSKLPEAEPEKYPKKEIKGFDWDKDKTEPSPCCEDCMKRNGVKEYCNIYLSRCPYYKASGGEKEDSASHIRPHSNLIEVKSADNQSESSKPPEPELTQLTEITELKEEIEILKRVIEKSTHINTCVQISKGITEVLQEFPKFMDSLATYFASKYEKEIALTIREHMKRIRSKLDSKPKMENKE